MTIIENVILISLTISNSFKVSTDIIYFSEYNFLIFISIYIYIYIYIYYSQLK